MELKSLYTVMKIMETGSYQKAAMALNYAQSTITFQIHQLENELGVRLFEKKGSRMVITPEGQGALPLMRQVIDAAEALLAYRTEADAPHGTMKIALPESLMTYKLQPVLKLFKEKAPDVRLYLQVMNCYAIYDQLLEGNIDLAIHYDIKKYPAHIKTVSLGTYPLAMVASPELDKAAIDLVMPDQRKNLCHIQNDPNALYLKILDRYLREKSITLQSGMEVWSIEAIKMCVTSGLGIAYLPRFTVEEELEKGVLKQCPMDMEGELTALCAYPRTKASSPAMRLFLELLGREFGVSEADF